MRYNYNGVNLEEPPLGFSGNMLLLYDNETSQYVMCYGSFYAGHKPTDPLVVSPIASIPACYSTRPAYTSWTELTISPDGDVGDDLEYKWLIVAHDGEFIWTNKDIYRLDSLLHGPTEEVVYSGTAAVLISNDKEPAKDNHLVSKMKGYMVGQDIRK